MAGFGTMGVANVGTAQLKRALRALHRGTLATPVDAAGLACSGLQDVADLLFPTLRGLNEAAVRAVLVTALAERLRKGPVPR